MSGEKTEQPTDKKIDDQRKEGQVPQRKYVIEAAFLTFSITLLFFLSKKFSEYFLLVIGEAFNGSIQEFSDSLHLIKNTAFHIVVLFIAFSFIVSIFTLFLGLLLNKFNFSAKSISLKFTKLNPINGFKSIFSKNSLYNFFRLLIYFSFMAILMYFLIYKNIASVINASYCGPICIYPIFAHILKLCVIFSLVILIILALFDYPIQTKLFRSQAKMSKDDVKNEYKNQEGDPLIKGKRHSLAKEDARAPTYKDATHIVYSDEQLVAIIYYPESKERPYVIGKVKGSNVVKLQTKLRPLGIPTFNMPNVARDFYHMASPGNYMPPRSAVGMFKILSRQSQES